MIYDVGFVWFWENDIPGNFEHVFNELLLQYPIEVSTDIYITHLKYENVYITYLKTDGRYLDEFIPDYKKCYDLTLMLFIRGKVVGEMKLSKNPETFKFS